MKSSSITMLLASLLSVASLPIYAATVSSMINLGSRQNDEGQTIDVVDVKCASASAEPRLIFSLEGERQWCSQDIPSICTRNKLSAAQRVCRVGFANQIEEYKNGEVATSDLTTQGSSTSDSVESTAIDNQNVIADGQAMVDEVELEKQQILIERQRLELRKQELELNKRRLELERQATTTQ
ncbi:MAG: hypothetical protein KTR16_14740 [Acidiferrobacterales bacterium]|nr:hypothetical protein [Acidiferrobacterales bacterium]